MSKFGFIPYGTNTIETIFSLTLSLKSDVTVYSKNKIKKFYNIVSMVLVPYGINPNFDIVPRVMVTIVDFFGLPRFLGKSTVVSTVACTVASVTYSFAMTESLGGSCSTTAGSGSDSFSELLKSQSF
ncbi:hypothetical protein BpHYR1_025356 [Brachionus plicatilis]|uniref:Uncharacterized protein n=1 Tax=Brachionus plicatilis TaxID=10195 RepID=A0A3M7RS51_BRAPC|nr:hypothetical protein BpHYR1_025356 [Brachionus plicatilis]